MSRSVITVESASPVVVTGKTKPWARVRIGNISDCPIGPLGDTNGKLSHNSTLVREVRADGRGNFSIAAPGAGFGDIVRLEVRTRGQRNPLDFKVVKLPARGEDTSRPESSVQGMRLHGHEDGRIAVEYLRKNRAIGEPLARVRFVNQRTRQKWDLMLDQHGCLPKELYFDGKLEDNFSVRITDGVHNRSLRNIFGHLCVVPPGKTQALDLDTVIRSDSTLRKRKFYGRFVDDGISATDPRQGAVGNCWLVASMSAIAHVDRKAISKRIRKLRNGNYQVTFSRYDHQKKRYVKEKVVVDRKLLIDNYGPRFGSSSNSTSQRGMEMWWPIVEKAYAAWRGGYDALSWGYPFAVFEALLETEGRYVSFLERDPHDVHDELAQALKEDKPVVCCTRSTNPRVLDRAGFVPDHAYTVLDCRRDGDECYVKVRNPWGEFEPEGHGIDDGVFEISLDRFMRFFVWAAVAE